MLSKESLTALPCSTVCESCVVCRAFCSTTAKIPFYCPLNALQCPFVVIRLMAFVLHSSQSNYRGSKQKKKPVVYFDNLWNVLAAKSLQKIGLFCGSDVKGIVHKKATTKQKHVSVMFIWCHRVSGSPICLKTASLASRFRRKYPL